MSPHVWGPPPPTDAPATALKTFGILSIVFALLNALGNALGIVQAALSARMLASPDFGGTPGTSPDPQFDAVREYSAVAMRVGAVEGGLMLLMDIALFTIGILLLKRREVGRKAAIVWSIVAFVVLALRAAAFEIFLWPRYMRMVGDMSSGASGSVGGWNMMSGIARAGTYGSLLVMAIYPVCLAVILSRPSVKETVVERQGESSALL